MQLGRYVLMLLIWMMGLFVKKVSTVYSTPKVFYSQFCSLYYVGPWSGPTFNCTATVPQSNIIRAGLVLIEYTKNYLQIGKFTAGITDPGSSATVFQINFNIQQPYNWVRLGFFAVIIKAQPNYKYIDLIPFSWSSGTAVDNNNAVQRSAVQSLLVTTLTIFTKGAEGLQLLPFVTSYSMLPPYNLGVPVYTTMTELKLTASFSDDAVIVTLTAQSQTQVSSLIGIVIVYNPPEVDVAKSNNLHMAFFLYPYSISTSLNITSFASAFGPNYENKCILGYQSFKYTTNDYVDLYFVSSSYGFYETFTITTYTAPIFGGAFFCYGNSTECGQGATYWDAMDGDCYTQTTCPLPVFSGWTFPTSCPNCTQLICLNCTASNRSNCLSCGPNSTLTNGTCICDTNYYEITNPISSYASGQWNNQKNSLKQCIMNCTLVIPNCNLTACANETFCNVCMPGYLLNLIAPDQQNCLNCSQAMPHCTSCIVLTSCITCKAGYYPAINASTNLGFCEMCMNVMAQCLTCTDNKTCLTCQTYYKVNTTTNLCDCDPVASKLANCLTCSIPTVCTNCTSNLYYLNLIDNLCYSCTTFDLQCIQCSTKNVCTLCQTGYTPKTNADGSALCVLCQTLISNCNTCSSPTVCVNCDDTYGLNSSNKCQLCNQLVAPKCINCENSSTCLSCEPSTVLIDNVCKLCSEQIFRCELCDLDKSSNVVCNKCQAGFYSSGNLCLICMNLFDQCSDCNSSQCLSCLFPYVLGPDEKCSQCAQGYWLVSGICMNIPGCVKSIIQPNGIQTCIACAQKLNFHYDNTLKKCVCSEGFTESNTNGQLMSCVNVCGDGIVSLVYEECDDKNNENNDGCDSTCKVEKNFTCLDEPSKCILNLNISSIIFNYVYRILGKNSGILSFNLEPKHSNLQKIDWEKLMKFNFPSSAVDPSALKFSYSVTTGELLVTVPYNEALQNSFLQTQFKFDPQILVSQPPIFFLGNKLNGINAPLVFEDASSLSTQKNISTISLILVLLLLLQFYLGSYFHKMIGLQTIQVIQSIYFVRMIARSVSTSVLNSMNAIEYSACGYENAQLFYGSLSDLNTRSMGVISPQFNAINMKQFFLLNVNLSLIPVSLGLIAFFISLFRKYKSRSKLIETKEQEDKDIFRDLRRSTQWVYDHILFPYVMMFNLISFFFSIEELTKQPFQDDNYQKFASSSFPAHITMAFMTIAIFCYEIFESIGNFIKYCMTTRQRLKMPISIVEKLQNDENYHDRANYHPAYVLIYLLYYLLLSFSMIISVLIKSFTYSLELTLGISLTYLIFIWVWKPYHESINLHNYFLRLYYFTFVLLLVICYLFSKVSFLSNGMYIGLMYVVMCLIGFIIIIGFVRILIEKRFRTKLQNDNSILQWISPNEDNILDQERNQKNNDFTENIQPSNTTKSKKVNLTLNNMYAFQNQLPELGKKYGLEPIEDQDCMIDAKHRQKNRLKLSKQDQEIVVIKIREQVKQLRQNLMIQQLISNFNPYYNKIIEEPQMNNSLTTKNDESNSPFLPNQQRKSFSLENNIVFSNSNNQITLKKIKQKLKAEWIYKNN